MSCTSASTCTGVGATRDSSNHRITLAERWNGTSWGVQPTPNPMQTGNELLAVSCVASVCTAVGNGRLDALATYIPLVERWNGSKWTIQRSLNPGGSNGGQLYGVSCTGQNACTAVGYYNVGSGGAFAVFAERWNGTSWVPQPTPSPPGGGFLNWVSCTATASCVAVGTYYDQFGTPLEFSENWDGHAWQIQQMPSPPGYVESNRTPTVSCSAANACTAVWSYLDSSGTWLPIAERWDGTAWTIEATPTAPDATLTYLYSVSCDAANSCTAVGFDRNSAAVDVTLAMHWDGSQWTIEPSPTPHGPGPAYLGDISCTAGAQCTAVGTYRDSTGTYLTLTEVRR